MRTSISISFTATLMCLSACSSDTPALTCESNDDCPATQSCLQGGCVALELPDVRITNPEHERPYAYGDGSTPHAEMLTITAANLTLRSLSDSSEAVPGEGHLVVFVDEIEVGEIETGELASGVQMAIEIPDVPGAHYIRVQARLNDGTNYDNDRGAARVVVWVDDGRQRVAFTRPWPNDTFALESQLVEGEVVALNGITIGPPNSGLLHVNVFYDESFPACLDDNVCSNSYVGLLPNDSDPRGPILFVESGVGTVTLTAVVMNPDHTFYLDELGEPVWSSIEVLRSDG